MGVGRGGGVRKGRKEGEGREGFAAIRCELERETSFFIFGQVAG